MHYIAGHSATAGTLFLNPVRRRYGWLPLWPDLINVILHTAEHVLETVSHEKDCTVIEDQLEQEVLAWMEDVGYTATSQTLPSMDLHPSAPNTARLSCPFGCA